MANLEVDGYPVIIFEWLLFALTTLLVLVRFGVQLRVHNWPPKREAFVLAAWLMYLYFTISDSVLNSLDFYNSDVPVEEFPDAGLKWLFVSDLVYIDILYCCKAALLCLYGDIAPRRCLPKTWFVVAFCWVLVISGLVLQPLSKFVPCQPLEENWKISLYDACHLKRRPWQYATWTLHLLTDVLVFVIPFTVLYNLPSISQKQKRGAYVIFALGFTNVASAVLLLVYYILPDSVPPGVAENFYLAEEFLTPFQAGSAVMIVCLPFLRKLWKGIKGRNMKDVVSTQIDGATNAAGPPAYVSSASKDQEIGVEVNEK